MNKTVRRLCNTKANIKTCDDKREMGWVIILKAASRFPLTKRRHYCTRSYTQKFGAKVNWKPCCAVRLCIALSQRLIIYVTPFLPQKQMHKTKPWVKPGDISFRTEGHCWVYAKFFKIHSLQYIFSPILDLIFFTEQKFQHSAYLAVQECI